MIKTFHRTKDERPYSVKEVVEVTEKRIKNDYKLK
jgi:hypothetical protein